jgi:hypothetical protein
MKRLWMFLLVLGVAGSLAQAQLTLFLSPDVATDPDGPPTYLPWDVVEHVRGGPAFYSLTLTVPGEPAVDALHHVGPGDWLFSVGEPSDLGGFLEVDPADVVLLGGLLPSPFFDASCVGPVPIPPGSNVDAVYLDGALADDLVVSFDVPTTLAGTTFLPSALVRYTRTGPAPCDWLLVGLEIDFQ